MIKWRVCMRNEESIDWHRERKRVDTEREGSVHTAGGGVGVKSKPIHARARTVLQSYMWSCSHGVSVVSLRCTGWAWMFCCSPGYPWPWDPPTWVLLGMRERPGPANSSFTLGKRKAIHLWTLVFFHNLLTSISRVPGKQNTPALFAVLSA